MLVGEPRQLGGYFSHLTGTRRRVSGRWNGAVRRGGPAAWGGPHPAKTITGSPPARPGAPALSAGSIPGGRPPAPGRPPRRVRPGLQPGQEVGARDAPLATGPRRRERAPGDQVEHRLAA